MTHWTQDRTQQQVLEQCVERMEFADRLGYYASWTTEHHFATDPTYLPYGLPEARFPAYDLASDPLTFLTYVAARTKQLRLGTAVLVLPYDNPIRVAERAALLDVLSGGRLELGIGRGSGAREHAAFGIPMGGNRAQYHEALEIVLRAWSGEPFSYQGEYFQIPELAVVPKPLQQPHPPIYIGSGSPESIRLTAERGFAYCSVAGSWGPFGLDRHKEVRDLYLASAAAAGRDVSGYLYPHVLLMYCGETDEEAEEVAVHYMMQFTLIVEAHYERQRLGGSTIAALGPNADADRVRQLAREMLALNIIGSPETCIRKLEAFKQVIDLNYFLGFVDFGGIPHDKVLASMERFARYVMPHFADQATPRAMARV
jgi:alkanesulfonate monooxygenase SsuD/methylene tetrahydromethanopterin reductase-like flavin-dependent oxidoreductase (luciferase family)